MSERRLFRVRRASVEHDVDDEMAFHARMRVEQFMAAGLPRDDAERAARAQFGDIAQVRTELVDIDRRTRRRRGVLESFHDTKQDLIVAVRAIRREPMFALGVILTLAIGIGSNATMFGIIDGLLLRGPRYVVAPRSVNRLYVTVTEPTGTHTGSGFGWVTYAALRDRATYFSAVAAYTNAETRSFGSGVLGRPIPVASATWDLFPALGVRPLLGRFFDASEDRPPRGQDVVVISEGLWRAEFGGVPSVIGRSITLGDARFTVVGVAPDGFTGAERRAIDAWLPMSLKAPRADWPTTYKAQWLRVIVRLKPGVDARAAGTEATSVLRAAYTGDQASMRLLEASVRPLWYANNGQPSSLANVSVWLMGVAVVVLLITIANMANLFAARARRRRREVAVRLALGAGNARLFRFIATETLVLSVVGAIAALLVAAVGERLMRVTLLSDISWNASVFDVRRFGFTLGLAILTGLVVGLAPAFDAMRVTLTASLKSGAGDGGGRRSQFGAALSVTQAALCVMLLVGAGLFVDSLVRSRSVDLGFQADRVIRASARFPDYDRSAPTWKGEKARQAQVITEAVATLARMTWVDHAAIAVGSPFGNSFGVDLKIPGRESVPEIAVNNPNISAVSSDYFATVGTPLRRGRVFTPADHDGTAFVAVVNETMARTLWPGEDAIGKCMLVNESKDCTMIVGVVADVHLNSLREVPSMQYYIPLGQERGFGGSVILVRPRGSTNEGMVATKRAFLAMTGMPYAQIATLQSAIDPEYRQWRLGAAMFGVFGALALAVAAVGLYSVIAYLVADRTRELGVRLALGATSGRITREVVGRGVATSAIGIAAGSALAMFAGRYIEPLLFNVSARDPRVHAEVALLVLLIAAAASWVPARRASRVDPAMTLRAE